MDSAKKGLLTGTMIYFIGNALISLIQLLLLPIITGKLEPADYGYYSFIITTGTLITPIVTLQITDAVFSFFFNSTKDEKEKYFTIAAIIIGIGILITAIGTIAVSLFVYPVENMLLVILYFVSNIILLLYTRMARCMEYNIEYVKTNFLRALLYIVFQIVFLLVFNMGVESLFLATVIATFISLVILELKLKLKNYFRSSSLDLIVLKEMLKFSIPLVPNTLLWWLVSSVNIYIISFKLGMDVNGIYTVANKFSGILTMITSVFLLAWQESVIKEYKKENARLFYNEVAYQYVNVVFTIVVLLIPFIKVVMPYLIAESYHDSIIYVPILLLGAGFAAITGFYGSMYAATRKTIGSMTTTIYGVICNVAVIFLLIDSIGLFAAAFSALLSNLLIVIARHLSFRKQMGITIHWRDVAILTIELIICSFVYYIGTNIQAVICFLICFTISIFLNKDILSEIIVLIRGKLLKGIS